MSHFPFSTVFNKDIQMERRCFSTSICPPIEIPATAAYPTHPCLPPGIRCVSWRREHPLGTVPSQAGISWGHGRLARSQVPHSGAQGGPGPLGELLSFTVCYSQTTHPQHTQASPSVPSTAACPYLHFYAPPPPTHTFLHTVLPFWSSSIQSERGAGPGAEPAAH